MADGDAEAGYHRVLFGATVASSAAAVAVAAAVWGLPGLRAAALGGAISVANAWILGRLARGAARAAVADGPATATSVLMARLTSKSIVLLMLVWIVARGPGVSMPAFALGLLALAASALAAGVAGAVRARMEARAT